MTVAFPWRKAWNPQRSIPSFSSKGWNLRFRTVSVSQGVPLRVANNKPKRFGLKARMYPRRCSTKSGEISQIRFPFFDLTV